MQAVSELARVLTPGGRLLVSVPAYQWAWTDHDVRPGHYRRYTRKRLVARSRVPGWSSSGRPTAFTTVFPFFVAERLKRRLTKPEPTLEKQLPPVSPTMDKVLMGLTRAEARALRHSNLPFGSSVILAATKPT